MLYVRESLFSLIIFFSCSILVLSEIPRPRGVSISKANLYAPGESFLCLDGLKKIKYTQVNDDFCDCADGSDEPGTSACPTGTFHCTNAGHRPKNIPSSRVNDGICDCCDASDEYDSGAGCINNCNELGREERQREKTRQELVKKGSGLKVELSNRGKVLKAERAGRLAELEQRKAEVERIKQEKEEIKKEAEDIENQALQIYRDAKDKEKEQQRQEESEKTKAEAQETFIKFDSNQDGIIEINEIRTRITFDKDRNGEVSIEEAKFFLDDKDQVDWDQFLNFAWPRIKPFMMLDSGLFQPPIIEKETEKPTTNEKHEELTEHEDDGEGVSDTESEDDERHVDEEGDEGEEEHEDVEPTGEAEEVDHGNQPDYDPETQQVIELANAARNDFNEADRTVREVETEIRKIKEMLEKDYGTDEEYAPLEGECFEYEDREYVYKLCPFDRASQQPRSGGSETRLGSWERWSGTDNKYSQMLFSNGASCWNGPQRSAVIEVHCGLENLVTSVTEPNRCEYHFVFQTPAACQASSESDLKDAHDEL